MSTTLSSPPPVLAAPLTPERIRKQHVAFLTEAADSDLPPGEMGRETVNGFIEALAASGAWLENAEERRAAQAILDYWVASLNMAPPEAETSGPVSARLSPFECAGVDAIGAKLDALRAGDQAIAVPLLAALVQPDERDVMRAVALPRKVWLSGLQQSALADPDRERVAQALLDMGVVVQSAEPEPSVELASSALISRWKPLDNAVSGRIRLRERARLWKQEGEADPSVFAKPPAGAERLLIARDELEQNYAAFRDRLVQRRLKLTLIVSALFFSGVLAAVFFYVDARKSEANTATAEARTARAEADAAKVKVEENLENQRKLQEPIRQAIATRDARALTEALRNAGVPVPDGVLTFASVDPATAERQTPRAAVQALNTPDDKDDLCRGAVWVGADGKSNLSAAPALDSDAWKGGSFVTTATLRLRRGTPDPVRGQPESIGIIPAGTTVVAEGKPVIDPTVRTPVYFVPITTAGPNCAVVYFQFEGKREAALALLSVLDDVGYTMRGPEEVSFTSGLAEIRYYRKDDAGRARGLAQRVRNALDRAGLLPGRPIAVQDFTNWRRTKPPPGTIELWLDLSDVAGKG